MSFARDSFVNEMERLISYAFIYKDEFLANFWDKRDGDELMTLYMTAHLCKIQIMDGVGQIKESRIITDEYLDWCDAIAKRETK